MYLFLLSIFFLPNAFAQSNSRINEILSGNRTEIDKLETVSTNSVTLLPSSFAKDDVAFKESVDKLKELTIVKVYYVYTSYRKNAGFNQKSLDRHRLQKLHALFPEIIEDPVIDWEVVTQTGCTSPEMGKSYFHGFIVIHRPIQTEKDRLAEIKRLEVFMKHPSDVFVTQKLDLIEDQLSTSSSSEIETTVIPDQDARYAEGPNAMLDYLKRELRTDEIALKRDDQWVKTHLKVDENGVLSDLTFQEDYPERIKNAVESAIFEMPNWEPAYKDSVPVSSELNLEVRVSYSPSVNGMYLINGDRPTLEQTKLEEKPKDLMELYSGSTPEEIFMKQAPVYKGLEIMDRTERCALVMDVTGSMTQHVASMIRWIGKHQDSLHFTSFTFFNDGDGKASRKKKIGSTGGIYTTFNVLDIENLVTETMRKGGGGERAESDIEALLFSQKEDTVCTSILLIADNYSEVRDIELLSSVNKRVHLLMCSAKGALRTEYLSIAKNTGGYLLFNGEVIRLDHLQRGDVLAVGSYQYDYNGKSFEVRKRDQDIGSAAHRK